VHEHVRRGEVAGNFRAADVAGEAHALAQAGGAGLLPQRPQFFPIAANDERRGRDDAGQGIDQHVEPFSLLQRAGRDHHRTQDAETRFHARTIARWPECVGVDTLLQQPHTVGPGAERDGFVAHESRRREHR
jgi:hypothetical protein